MIWTMAKASKLPHSAARTRILEELSKNRAAPVTGSYEYWEKITAQHSIDYKKRPDLYRIGKGEQGVLSTHPYTEDVGQFWRFKTEEDAVVSADMIYTVFEFYLRSRDFVGADIARKYLQMGYTRARRYANHPSGKKYSAKGKITKQAADALTSEKAHSADVFKMYWDAARENLVYQSLKRMYVSNMGESHA